MMLTKSTEVLVNEVIIFGELKDVALLRPGSFVDAFGRKVTFNEDDLRQIVTNFDPKYHDPPVTVDHRNSGPAFGWVRNLRFDEGKKLLLGDFKDVPQETVDLVKEKRIQKISSEVYMNFEGKGKALRAATLLGSAPPAVKGMPSLAIAFSEDPSESFVSCEELNLGVVNVHSQGKEDPKSMMDFNAFKDWFESRFGAFFDRFLKDSVIPTTLTEPKNDPKVAALAEELESKTKELVTLQGTVKSLQENVLQMSNSSHRQKIEMSIAKLKDAGLVSPAMEKAGLVDILCNLSESVDEVVIDGKKISMSEALLTVLGSGPKFSELFARYSEEGNFDPKVAALFDVVDLNNQPVVHREEATQFAAELAENKFPSYEAKRARVIQLMSASGGGS